MGTNGSWYSRGEGGLFPSWGHVARPSLRATGNLTLNNRRPTHVAGELWLQHIWSSGPSPASPLSARMVGADTKNTGSTFLWAYFNLVFDTPAGKDGRFYALQCVVYRAARRRPAPCAGGALAAGNASAALPPDLALVASANPWTSRATNATYFADNRLASAALGLDVTLRARVPDDELPGADFPYYEATGTFAGTLFGAPTRGHGAHEVVRVWNN